MYHSFFIHSSVDGYLGCFHVLGIVNSAARNTEVHVSFSVILFSGYSPVVLLDYLLIQIPMFLAHRQVKVFTEHCFPTMSTYNLYMNAHGPKVDTNVHQQINEQQSWYIYTMEYQSIIKRNEWLKYTATWMNLKNNCAEWKMSGQKYHTGWFHLYIIIENAF